MVILGRRRLWSGRGGGSWRPVRGRAEGGAFVARRARAEPPGGAHAMRQRPIPRDDAPGRVSLRSIDQHDQRTTMPAAHPDNRVDFENLGGVLSGLDRKWDDLDANERQRAALLAFGRRATALPPLPILMQDAVALIAEVLRTDWSGSAEVLSGGQLLLRLAPAAQPGAEPSIHRLPADPTTSMAAFALETASPVVSEHLASETRFNDAVLRRLGMVAALNVPLRLDRQSFGALGVYSSRPRSFSPDDVGFAETIAHLLTSSIARVKTEEQLREHSELANALMQSIDTLVFLLDAEGNLHDLNAAAERAAGFRAAELRGKPFCGVCTAPGETEAMRAMLRRVLNGKAPGAIECHLVAKDGKTRRVAWKLCPLCDAMGFVRMVVLCGDDRTELVEARSELERSRTTQQQLAAALQRLRWPTSEKAASPSDVARSGSVPAIDNSRGAAEAPASPRPFESLAQSSAEEKRTSPRRRYQYRQMIAPMIGATIPRRRDFYEVDCEDISAGGISFYLERPPDFESLVVALGRPPTVSYFTARVVRIVAPSPPERPRYLIGCRFTGRVHL